MRDKEGYWYKNETLIDKLGITKKEQKHMKTIIGLDEKYDRNNERRRAKRRNEEGLTKKQQELKVLQDKIIVYPHFLALYKYVDMQEISSEEVLYCLVKKL